ncbi:hypothetical protein EVAR_39451_1 [Eumeta japonica]|uniref:Uncharacterized protein n=1 Tax=Eumeta variegata TaxID=151549 RepID=A0A4C1W056_EUMVA|nr:hypothetical protein EVAR_39451_1 [Eumeta japonica]
MQGVTRRLYRIIGQTPPASWRVALPVHAFRLCGAFFGLPRVAVLEVEGMIRDKCQRDPIAKPPLSVCLLVKDGEHVKPSVPDIVTVVTVAIVVSDDGR